MHILHEDVLCGYCRFYELNFIHGCFFITHMEGSLFFHFTATLPAGTQKTILLCLTCVMGELNPHISSCVSVSHHSWHSRSLFVCDSVMDHQI